MSERSGFTIKGILKSIARKFRQDPEKLEYLEVVVLVGVTVAFLVEIVNSERLSIPRITGMLAFAIGINSLPVIAFYIVSWFDFLRRFNPLIYFLLLFGILFS